MIHGAGTGAFGWLVAAWWGMMAAMMLPVTWPWLRVLARLSARAGGAGGLPSAVLPSFVTGYLLVWLGFGLGAAALQTLLHSHGSPDGPVLRSVVLAAAGAYQLTPLKAACLDRCRSPFSVVLARWPFGGPGAARLGVEHGVACLGCCWVLMLIGLGAGAAGWTWMAALAGLVAVEKLANAGPRVARWAGGALLLLALVEGMRGWR